MCFFYISIDLAHRVDSHRHERKKLINGKYCAQCALFEGNRNGCNGMHTCILCCTCVEVIWSNQTDVQLTSIVHTLDSYETKWKKNCVVCISKWRNKIRVHTIRVLDFHCLGARDGAGAHNSNYHAQKSIDLVFRGACFNCERKKFCHCHVFSIYCLFIVFCHLLLFAVCLRLVSVNRKNVMSDRLCRDLRIMVLIISANTVRSPTIKIDAKSFQLIPVGSRLFW